MSRRRIRLINHLGDLADALEQVESYAGQSSVAPLLGTIRRFLIPRLADPPPPLVVAVVGSTGAGKSTLINSVAGLTVGEPGVLRPTTDHVVVWTGPSHAERLWPGEVVVGEHPLAESVALIDTPDLDSDVVEHRNRAIDALVGSDAAVFVTTGSRYGDASPWEVLQSLVDKPLVVVINRLPTRASGARNDLAARMRAIGQGTVPVLTISEQRVDPESGLLRHQAVQRLAIVLREWAAQTKTLRVTALGAATDRLANDLASLIERLEDQSTRADRATREVRAAYEAAAQTLARLAKPGRNTKRLLTGRRDDELVGRRINALDAAAAAAAAAMESEGFDAPPDLWRASPAALVDHSKTRRKGSATKRDWISGTIEGDRQRFLDRLAVVPEDVLERLRNGAEVIDGLDWANV